MISIPLDYLGEQTFEFVYSYASMVHICAGCILLHIDMKSF